MNWLWRIELLASLFVACGLLAGCHQALQGPPVTQDGRKLVEVSVFQGGYDIDFWEDCARQYEKLHPDVKVNLWGDPRNDEKLRPRFIAQEPPDLVNAYLPIWLLIYAGQATPLDEALDSPAYGQPEKTWRETLYPSAYADFEMNGQYWALTVPYAAFGFWYSQRQFREYGWEVPRTWSELLRLCEQIQATSEQLKASGIDPDGIDPIGFQGRYPGYIQSVFETLVQRIDGVEAWLAMQNLEPGAWNSDAVVQAWTLVQELRKKEYIPDKYMGLSHMESQMEFVAGDAAMIPCGTWLATEMKSKTPPGFDMGFIHYPMVEGGKGDPTAINCSGEFWFVPTHAHYPEIGADILKLVTSLDMAKEFVRRKRAPMAVKGCEEEAPPELQGAVEAIRRAHFIFTSRVAQWYPTFGAAYDEACGSIMTLSMTPEEAGAYLERAAAAQRQDRRMKRHIMPNPLDVAATEPGGA